MKETSELVICDDFVFDTEKSFSILTSQKALELYSEKLESALSFENDIPIFLDTNVLLDYYRISFSERDELIKFFEKNKERIYLTKQIEQEFLRHRIDHIRSYLNSLDEFVNAYRNIRAEIERLKNGEIKGFDHYITKNIILKNDYQDLRKELSTFNDTLKEKLKNLFSESDFEVQIEEKEKKIEDIRKRLEGQADIERNDPLLNVISKFQLTPELSKDEQEILKMKFDCLTSVYDSVKNDQNKNWKSTFPGCGEKKENPYGDFVIYHEIIKFLKTSKTDAVFLTNDVEKNDWLLKNKADYKPYTHYIINSYALSEQTLYIFNAQDKIRVSYSPVYTENESEEDVIIDNESNDFIDNEEEKDEIEGKKLKVIGKINVDTHKYNFYSEYDDITKKEFLRELAESQKWAENYGSGFVGLNSFIMKYLGAKGYHYRSSYDVKDELVREGLVEIYTHTPETTYYNPVDAIRLVEENNA